MKPIIQKIWMVMVVLCLSISASAYDFELPAGYGSKLQYTILSSVDQTVAVVGGTTGIIPCSVTYNNKNYTVTEIGQSAFSSVEITDYRLPLSLKAIRRNAFGHNKASTIAIPDGVEIIESDAFWYSSVETIIIGSGVKYIGDGAFYGCSNLKTLVFRPQKAPTHESRNYSIGNKYTTVIVPQLQGYVGSEIARVNAGTMIEPIYFPQQQYVYSGKIPELDYVKKIASASPEAHMNLKNKDVGDYEQSFYIGLSQVIPSYRFTDFDGYAALTDRGIDVLYEYSITKKPLSVKIENHQRLYGDPNPSSFSYSIDGFVDGENENQLLSPVKCETTASIHSPVGSYPITCNPSALNYSFEIQQGTFNIQKAPLTVIAENAERQYGESNPTFSCSYSGFKLDDTESSAFSSLPSLSCIATKTSSIGEYPIVANGGTSQNYEIVSYENGVLNINKAPLTLVANDKSRLYFEENPSFDFTLIGLRNSDTKSCLSMQPTFKCAAVKTSNAGEYEIEPLNATAQNYTIDYQKGTLSINKRALTASVGNYTKIYGSENPQFEIEYIGFVNNEDSSSLTNAPNIVCSANKSSDVGSYPISLEGGNALNYDINKYNSGTLTIEKANQTITWNQDLSNIQMYSQVALEASSSANLPITYEMSPNNVATLYNNNGTWYLDCFGNGTVTIRAVQNGDKNYNAAPMVSNTLVVMGTGGDPSNPQIFLNIENAGTLPNLIADNRKYQIKNLRLTGYLNGSDINFLREMAGSDNYGNNTPGVLETLDISGCTIVSGGLCYYKSYQTYNNKVSDYMFYNCKQLVNLMLPENTNEIEDYAFADCDRLSIISIPDDVKSFGIQSFRNNISLLRIPMPNGLISIKDNAFIGCNGISEITIPASVTNIGDRIVKDCQNISKINVAEGNKLFVSEDGVLYSSNFDELLIFPVNYESNSYIVKNGTKTIAPYAFVNSKKLNEVTLPSTLTNIGEDAFIGCVNLLSLQIKALNPPVCYNDCFEKVSKTRCELIVPKGCYSYYWVAPVWSDFNKIKESDFSNIDDTLSSDIRVGIENGNIVIGGVPESIRVRIFKVDGTLIHQVQSSGDIVYYTPAQSGIYIVVIANKTYKLRVH